MRDDIEAEVELIELNLDQALASAVQALATQGILGATPEAVIEHCLRQYLFDQTLRLSAKEKP